MEQAARIANEAIEKEPENVRGYVLRAEVHFSRGDLAYAFADLQQVLQIDPENQAAAEKSKSILDDLYADAICTDDENEAIRLCGELIRLDPKHVKAYGHRAFRLLMQRDYDRAISDYDQAIQLDPQIAEYHRMRGRAWQCKGDEERAAADYDEAIRLLSEAIQHDPKSAKAYRDRAQTYKLRDDYDRAIADYDVALQLDPNSEQATIGRETATLFKAVDESERAAAFVDGLLLLVEQCLQTAEATFHR